MAAAAACAHHHRTDTAHSPGAEGLEAMVAAGFSSPPDCSDSVPLPEPEVPAALLRRREVDRLLEALGVLSAAAAPAVTAPSTAG